MSRRHALALGAAAIPATAALTGAAKPPAAAAGPPAPGGTVTAPSGRTWLADSRGRALTLRGFNLGKGGRAAPEDIDGVADRGFTLLRLVVMWDQIEPEPGRCDAGFLDYLDAALTRADRRGLHVLVDFHQDVYGAAFGSRGIPAWATRTDGLPFTPDPDDWFAGYFQPAVQRAFQHLYDDPDLRAAQARAWAAVARRLRGHRSLLGYDLFNEPFGPTHGATTDDPVRLAAAAAELERGRLAGMYRRLIAAVRQVDRNCWLFVEPTVLVGEGVPTALPGFDDPRRGEPRIGYAPHFYDTAVEGGADWNPGDGFVDAYRAAITAYPNLHRMPVLVGEWGPPSARTPGNAELVRRQLDAMSGFAAGWTMWYWCRSADGGGYCVLDPDGRPNPGDEPVFAPYARAVAGLPEDESYDAGTGTYSLAYRTTRTAHGPTELVVPQPGSRIDVAGAPHRTVTRGPVAEVHLTAPPGSRITVAVTRP